MHTSKFQQPLTPPNKLLPLSEANKLQTMASHSPISATTIISLLLISIPYCTHSLNSTEMEDCVPRLLQLAPCAPFVQGSSTSPTSSCCDNLSVLYVQRPMCLCGLVNGTTAFPINQTLALELPLLCNLQANSSTCPGLLHLPPGSSPSGSQQVFSGSNANSSTAVSPSVALPPAATSTVHFSSGTELKVTQSGGASFVVMAATTAIVQLLWIKIF